MWRSPDAMSAFLHFAEMVPGRTHYSRSLLKVPFAHVIVG
jgi:hypothetical protein